MKVALSPIMHDIETTKTLAAYLEDANEFNKDQMECYFMKAFPHLLFRRDSLKGLIVAEGPDLHLKQLYLNCSDDTDYVAMVWK